MFRDIAYSVGYQTDNRDSANARLYRSTNGREFERWISKLYTEGYPNESSLVCRNDGSALCLLRP